MHIKKVIFIIICSLLCIISVYADGKVNIEYAKPKNATESVLKTRLETSDAIESVTSFINDYFHLRNNLVFFFGDEDGPLYDSEKSQITIPYSFATEVENRFIKTEYENTGVSVKEATDDTLMHTMFHEFAHAIIFMYELPVLGKEEDAADALATVLLTEFFEDGQEIVLSAADLFNLESDDLKVLEEEDFWDEHSLDVQRYYSTLCHVYGSDPEKYSAILEDEHFSKERAELCIEEYENTSRSWLILLRPYMKHN